MARLALLTAANVRLDGRKRSTREHQEVERGQPPRGLTDAYPVPPRAQWTMPRFASYPR